MQWTDSADHEQTYMCDIRLCFGARKSPDIFHPAFDASCPAHDAAVSFYSGGLPGRLLGSGTHQRGLHGRIHYLIGVTLHTWL